jgi:Helix-turn-helix domain
VTADDGGLRPSDPLPRIEEIRDRIVFARRRAGLTQIALARELGVSERTMQNYESGVFDIPSAHVPIIERLANLPHGWILYPEDDPENGSVRPGFVVLVVSVLVLLFAPPPAAAEVSCHCGTTFPARQPRVKLARRSVKEDPTR